MFRFFCQMIFRMTRSLGVLCISLFCFTAPISAIGDSTNWLAFGAHIDVRFDSHTAEKSSALDTSATLFSGSLEWAGMAQNESIFFQMKVLPGFTDIGGQYTDDFEDYPAGDITGSNLGMFSYITAEFDYRVVQGQWGILYAGFNLAHQGIYVDTGNRGGAERLQLFYSNFFAGPTIGYGRTFFNLIYVRTALGGDLSIWSRNNESGFLYLYTAEIWFPMDFEKGWSRMNEQYYMLKLAFIRKGITASKGDTSLDFGENKIELGFYWVY